MAVFIDRNIFCIKIAIIQKLIQGHFKCTNFDNLFDSLLIKMFLLKLNEHDCLSTMKTS